MDDTNRIALLNELNGLETAQYVIARRMNEIADLLRLPMNVQNIAAPRTLRPLPVNDPSVLGRDILGRIKKKRNLSPEQRQAKRELITKARNAKLDRLKEMKMGAERPGELVAPVTENQPLASFGGTKQKR